MSTGAHNTWNNSENDQYYNEEYYNIPIFHKEYCSWQFNQMDVCAFEGALTLSAFIILRIMLSHEKIIELSPYKYLHALPPKVMVTLS